MKYPAAIPQILSSHLYCDLIINYILWIMAMNDLSHLLLPDMGDKEDPTVMEETKVSDGEESENGEYLSDNGQQAQ